MTAFGQTFQPAWCPLRADSRLMVLPLPVIGVVLPESAVQWALMTPICRWRTTGSG